jgi:protease-4
MAGTCAYQAVSFISSLCQGSEGVSRFDRNKNKIIVLSIYGEINEAVSRQVIESIKNYEEDDGVKALVLRLNTPGGSVASSQEIAGKLLKIRKKNIKVVVSMGDIAASGGYYIASAADQIVAQEGSITGSIGVIAAFPDLSDLSKKVGAKFNVIKSGEFKDAGSPWRALSDNEKILFQDTVDDLYGQFVAAVMQGRNLKITEAIAERDAVDIKKVTPEMLKQTVLSLAKGQIFSGKKAYALKLVDALGGLEDAIDLAAKLSGIVGKPTVIFEKKKISLMRLFENLTDLPKLLQPWHPLIKYELLHSF